MKFRGGGRIATGRKLNGAISADAVQGLSKEEKRRLAEWVWCCKSKPLVSKVAGGQSNGGSGGGDDRQSSQQKREEKALEHKPDKTRKSFFSDEVKSK